MILLSEVRVTLKVGALTCPRWLLLLLINYTLGELCTAREQTELMAFAHGSGVEPKQTKKYRKTKHVKSNR